MPIQIVRTGEMQCPSLVLCLYGQPGTGKSTLASTAPKPIFCDAEESTKAFKIRGIDVPTVQIKTWSDVQEAWGAIAKSEEYETVVIDPIDVFLGLLIEDVKDGGSMNIGKWGLAKERMRKFLWAIKSSGKNVIFIAHEGETEDDGKVLREPKLAANLSDELVAMCDVLGHLRVGEGGARELLVQPTEKWKAKDRTDLFGTILKNPNITDMITKIKEAYNKEPFPDHPEPKVKKAAV